MEKFSSVEAYFQSLSGEPLEKLSELRDFLKSIIPGAEEVISYGMPALKKKKVVVYYYAFKNHIGFFPTSAPIAHFADKLKDLKTSKGTVQLPYDKPFPKELLREMVVWRLENL